MGMTDDIISTVDDKRWIEYRRQRAFDTGMFKENPN